MPNRFQLAMEDVTERAGFVAAVNFLGQGELFLGPEQEMSWT